MTQSREPPSPLLDSIEANKSKRRQRASAVAVVSLVEFALILLSYGILSFCAGRLVQRALTYPPTQNLAPLENTTGNISFEKGLVRVHDHNARHVVTTVGRYSRSVPQTWVHSVHRSTAQSMLSTRFLEALVHPALLVHDNPVHALVVCDDPAACSLILNEVRQHTNTVESVVTFLTPLIALARDTTSQCLLQSDGTTVSALSSVDSTFLQFQWDKDAYGSRQARRQSTNQSCIVEKDSLDVVLVARL
jgi:hypothetical protein